MIVWKDVFKPRYALVVSLQLVPSLKDGVPLGNKWVTVPVISHLPYKRPLSVSFNEFCNGIRDKHGQQSLAFYGSRRTMLGLYGIGSALPHNINNAIVFAQEECHDNRRKSEAMFE